MTLLTSVPTSITPEHGDGTNAKTSLGSKLQWFLAWEKAYLDEQESVASHQKNDVETNTDNSNLLNEKTLNVKVDEKPLDSQYRVFSDAALQVSVNTHSSTVSQAAVASGLPPAKMAAPSPLAVAKAFVSEASRLVVADTKTVQTQSATNQQMYKKPEFPSMVVTRQGEEARVWMRQSNAANMHGAEIVVKLREVLASMGMRLASLTVNGERLWQKREGDMTSLEYNNTTSLDNVNKLI